MDTNTATLPTVSRHFRAKFDTVATAKPLNQNSDSTRSRGHVSFVAGPKLACPVAGQAEQSTFGCTHAPFLPFVPAALQGFPEPCCTPALRHRQARALSLSHRDHTRNRFRAGRLIDVFPCRQLVPLGHQPLPATLPGKSQVLSPVTLSHQHAPTMRNKKRSIDGTIDKQIGATHHSTIPKHTHAAGSERTVWGARWGTCCNNRPFRLSCCRLPPNLAGAGGLLFAPGAPCCRCC